MKVTLWGARGSIPCLEPDMIRYGGNTSCVEVRGAGGTLLVLDAGTGIKRLGETLEPEISRVDILLTHLHIDHILGLGFFRPIDRPDMEIHIWGPPSLNMDLRSRLGRYLSPPIFPIHIRDLRSDPTFHDVPRGKFIIGELEVLSDLVFHPGPTVGYRVSERGKSIVYLPDHEPVMGARRFPANPDWVSGFDLAQGADLLIHDAQFSEAEYADRVGWGHSSITHAMAFAALSRVRTLVTFHHDPNHTDSQLDELMGRARETFDLVFELVPGLEGARFRI